MDRRLPDDEQEAQRQEQRRLFFVAMTRTTNIVVFSSYSELDAATAHRLQAAQGRWVRPGVVRTFASSFLEELGPECPQPVRGEAWDYYAARPRPSPSRWESAQRCDNRSPLPKRHSR
jgi:superfamily I DNA/RNA helicase